MNPEQLNQQLTACKQLAAAGRYAEALAAAQAIIPQHSQNLALHRLLAVLYGLNQLHVEAVPHYMLLAQFDPEFQAAHCLELAQEYHRKGMTILSATLAHAGAAKLADADLTQLAAHYYELAGKPEKARLLLGS